MFQFGLFSTFIPYLIFAISYIGFLGYNALQKEYPLDLSHTTQQIELNSNNHSEILFIDNLQCKFDKAISDNYLTFTSSLWIIHDYIFIYDVGNYLREYHYQEIFSRPPPEIVS